MEWTVVARVWGKNRRGLRVLEGTELQFCRTQGVLELEGAVVAQLCEVT